MLDPGNDIWILAGILARYWSLQRSMRSQRAGGIESHVARSCFNCIAVDHGDHSSLYSHLSDNKKAGEKVFLDVYV